MAFAVSLDCERSGRNRVAARHGPHAGRTGGQRKSPAAALDAGRKLVPSSAAAGSEQERTAMPRRMIVLAAVVAILASFAVAATASAVEPDLGPNVLVFDPSMPTSQIQAAVDAVATQQIPNQFGTARYALLFKPGTYGSSAEPLNFQVGYYTAVAGLGRSPGDTIINGSVYVHNQC